MAVLMVLEWDNSEVFVKKTVQNSLDELMKVDPDAVRFDNRYWTAEALLFFIKMTSGLWHAVNSSCKVYTMKDGVRHIQTFDSFLEMFRCIPNVMRHDGAYWTPEALDFYLHLECTECGEHASRTLQFGNVKIRLCRDCRINLSRKLNPVKAVSVSEIINCLWPLLPTSIQESWREHTDRVMPQDFLNDVILPWLKQFGMVAFTDEKDAVNVPELQLNETYLACKNDGQLLDIYSRDMKFIGTYCVERFVAVN